MVETAMEQFHSTTSDTAKINAVGVLCEKMMDAKWMDYQKVQFNLVNNALEKKLSDNEEHFLLVKKASSLRNLGIMKRRLGDYQTALEYYSQGLELSIQVKDSSGISVSYNNLGLVYKMLGQIDEAIRSYDASIKIDERLGNNKQLATTLINMASIYKQQEEFEIEKQYLAKAFDLAVKGDDKRMKAVCLNSMGINHARLRNIEAAFTAYDQSMALHKEVGDIRSYVYSLNNKAMLKKKTGEPEEALTLFEEGLKIALDNNYKNLISTAYQRIGLIHYEQNRFDQAISFGQKSYKIAKQTGIVQSIINSSRLLYRAKAATGNYRSALEFYKLNVHFEDSLNNESNQKAAIQQQAKYEYEKQKAVDDAQHEKQLAIEQEAKEKQQILTYSTAVGLGLVGIFLLFVFNRLKVTRKQKGVIELAHTELEEKNQEILDSINYAKRIQSAILPPDKVVKSYLEESFVFYLPKDIVAGDFYWLEQVENKILFAAADCTGHGVPGAMVSVVCNNGLNRSVREHGLLDPGKILDKTREIVVQEFEKSEEEVKDGMDIALCCLEGNTLHYAGAHNPLWLIRKDANEIEEYKADKQPIGKYENSKPYTTHSIELNTGDLFYIFSDGYADQFGGEKGKKLKSINFKKLLLSIRTEPMAKQKILISEAFEKWKGNLEQLDDVCVIGVKI